ncbi:MAG: hypothetical protein BWY31_03061 [Lentisphaerae bacterium ADurb.Bin242]|nr:MAG: hypothetical protein BWY31_03061 [Lentisphaerae bacterium ADurb.Bin242]
MPIDQKVLFLLYCYLFQQYRLCGFCHDDTKSQNAAWVEGKNYYQKNHLDISNIVIEKLEYLIKKRLCIKMSIFLYGIILIYSFLSKYNNRFMKKICLYFFLRKKHYIYHTQLWLV